ncbi:hypothetical protein HHI36_003469 [Cryptolaemus montrouzieri]|uniref:Solute carrier family 46 member 3 n=1 Tax=Cryptolaemus montrouzieri TaxID=559131 RepID=A0ABD2PEG1_9CUCU
MSLPNIRNAISVELLASNDKSKNLTFLQKVKYMATHITVEPLVFFYILPGAMGLLTSQNLYLEKACRVNLNYSSSVCDAMVRRDPTGYEEYQETEVQKLVATMLSIKTAVIGFFPTLILLFFGSWSDRHQRRKPVILIPIICDILSGIELIICSHFFMELSIEYVTFADSIPYAIGGGWSCVFLGVFSYISGISSDEDRTIRIGTVSMIQTIAITIGNAVGGFLIGPLGIRGSFILLNITMMCCAIYGYIVIKDEKIDTVKPVEKKGFIRDFLDVEHVKNTFKMCFKEGSSNRKWKIIVLMMATVLIAGPQQGELACLYLYTRKKFGWSEKDYSIFNTVQFSIQIVGSVFALYIFSKKLKLDDATLGIIALTSKISACLIYAFVPTGKLFFLGCLVEIFHGTCYIALRSIMAKIVPPNELGQSNSVFGVCEALMPLAFGPFYTTLYNYTIKFFPGGFYVVSAGLYLIAVPLFIWLYRSSKEDQKTKLQKKIYTEQEENLLKKAILNDSKKSLVAIKN